MFTDLIINDWDFKVPTSTLDFIDGEYNQKEYKVLPKKEDLFLSFELTSLENTKVVILGQDPYPNSSDAMGLAFSVRRDDRLPPSLKNIIKELNADLDTERVSGDLTSWAEQGVLLFNTTLIVREGRPGYYGSRKDLRVFIEEVIRKLNARGNVCFVLLGKHSQSYASQISDSNFIISTSHPSPLAAHRGFLGSRIFSKINNFLMETGQTPIKWEG